MEINLSRPFQKEVRSLSAPVKIRVLAIIERVIEAETLADIPNLKIMEGAHDYYRIRLGNYRIGIYRRADNVIEFQRVGTRGGFYNRFP
jgi:mRNA interferase RelE/StbE